MTNKDNQYYIFIQNGNQKIPVTKEEFDAYYKETSVFRRRQMRQGLCSCPKRKWLYCDTDCEKCRYRFDNYSTYSMDETIPGADDDDGEMTKHDVISDGSPWFADVVADVDQMQILLNRIREIMPEAIQMGELRLKGQTDAVIADALGIPRTTLLSRLKKLRKMLDAEVSDIL